MKHWGPDLGAICYNMFRKEKGEKPQSANIAEAVDEVADIYNCVLNVCWVKEKRLVKVGDVGLVKVGGVDNNGGERN